MSENAPYGYIKVKVMTGNGAYPVENATVAIKKSGDEKSFKVLVSDSDGDTEKVAVIAPREILSEQPFGERPYNTFDIYVSKDRYYTNVYKGVQVFADTVSLQNVYMLPLPEEGGIANEERVFVITPHNLSQGGGML